MFGYLAVIQGPSWVPVEQRIWNPEGLAGSNEEDHKANALSN